MVSAVSGARPGCLVRHRLTTLGFREPLFADSETARHRSRFVGPQSLRRPPWCGKWPPVANQSAVFRKSPPTQDCVVELRGLELRARHAVVSNQSLGLGSKKENCRAQRTRTIAQLSDHVGAVAIDIAGAKFVTKIERYLFERLLRRFSE